MISTPWKIALVALGALILLAVGFWIADEVRAVQDNAEKWRETARHRAETVENLERDISDARFRTDGLEASLAFLEVELDEWENRPPEVVEIIKERIRSIPVKIEPEVEEFLKTYKREIKWTDPDGAVSVYVPDAILGDTVLVDLDADIICRHWISTAGDCTSREIDRLKEPPEKHKIKSPIRFDPDLELEAGYGIAGLDARAATFPLKIGTRKFEVGFGAWAWATQRSTGEVVGNASVGVRVYIGN